VKVRATRLGIVCFILSVLAASVATGAETVAPGLDVNARAADGSSALHRAAQNDDVVAVDRLLAHGAKVDAQTDLGVTALWIAASNSSSAMVDRLLRAHADPNIAPPTGVSPLMVAARLGNAAAVKALLAHGADPNAKETTHAQTALMWATANRHPDVVRLLLDAHADVRARTTSSMQRVMLCCQYFEDESDGVVMMPTGGYTALLFAAQDGDVESAKLLLAAGADIKDTAADGSSALLIAAHAEQAAVGALLLDAGADPNQSSLGYTALHIAATSGDVALVKALLDHGADINARQLKGSPTKRMANGHALDIRMVGATPYFLAVRAGQLEVMKLLVARGADPTIPLKDGRTALMVLAGQATVEGPSLPDAKAGDAIKLAVQLGTPVNQAGPDGNTALHIAATRRRDEIVQALADSGAALDVRNAAGETPLAAALKPPTQIKGSGMVDDYEFLRNHTQTADLLRKLGAKS
jgi:ankyrin repeat protein